MTHNDSYYKELRMYEIKWKKFMMGFDLDTVKNMVYNETNLAKQKIVFCDGKEFMVVKVTEAVMDVMKFVLGKEHIEWIKETR